MLKVIKRSVLSIIVIVSLLITCSVFRFESRKIVDHKNNRSEIKKLSGVDNNLFSGSEYVYNHDLALKSIELSVASFTHKNSIKNWGENSSCGRENDVKEKLTEFGFSNLNFYNYNISLNDTSSKVAFATGEKWYSDDTIIIVVAIRGGRYGLEWADNFNIGNSNSEHHNGFYNAALGVKLKLMDLFSDYPENFNLKLWITGYSRGGAVANILSALLINEPLLNKCQVYAYTFASPKTTVTTRTLSHNEIYKNIFNILSPNDPLYNIPPAKWGFGRYGICVEFPDSNVESETDNKIFKLVSEYYRSKTGKTLTIGDNISDSIVNLIIKSSESRDFFHEFLSKPLMDLIIIKMTKEKNASGFWDNALSDKTIVKMYGDSVANEISNVKNSYFFKSLNSLGVSLPDDVYIFMVLCKINGFNNYDDFIINKINLNEFYNVSTIKSSDLLYVGHSTWFYISWLTICPQSELKFIYD